MPTCLAAWLCGVAGQQGPRVWQRESGMLRCPDTMSQHMAWSVPCSIVTGACWDLHHLLLRHILLPDGRGSFL